MSKGYITIAQNSEDIDYLEMSYALALSLKATQKINNLCVCVDKATKKLTKKVLFSTNKCENRLPSLL